MLQKEVRELTSDELIVGPTTDITMCLLPKPVCE